MKYSRAQIRPAQSYTAYLSQWGVEFENLKNALEKIANKEGQFKIYG